MFTKRRISPHVYNKLEQGLVDYSFSLYYTPTPVDEFTFEKVENIEGGESLTLTSDITMLFNQKRLDKCSNESLLHYFDSLSVTNSPLRELRSKLSDDQLISIVKSRYLQSPSELLTYSESLVHEYGSELAMLAQHSSSESYIDPSTDPVSQ